MNWFKLVGAAGDPVDEDWAEVEAHNFTEIRFPWNKPPTQVCSPDRIVLYAVGSTALIATQTVDGPPSIRPRRGAPGSRDNRWPHAIRVKTHFFCSPLSSAPCFGTSRPRSLTSTPNASAMARTGRSQTTSTRRWRRGSKPRAHPTQTGRQPRRGVTLVCVALSDPETEQRTSASDQECPVRYGPLLAARSLGRSAPQRHKERRPGRWGRGRGCVEAESPRQVWRTPIAAFPTALRNFRHFSPEVPDSLPIGAYPCIFHFHSLF
jgi:hypothetical protein